MKRFFFATLVALAGIVPTAASAQLGSLLPTCATGAGNCSTCHLIVFLVNLGEAALQVIGIILLASIVVGGFYLMISAGSSERVQRGKAIITGGIVGTLLVFFAYVIINFVIAAFLGADTDDVRLFGTEWSSFCEDRLSITDPHSDCTGVPNGEACSASGQCVIVNGQEICHCYEGDCVNDCEVNALKSDDVSSATCVESDSVCKTKGGETIGEASCQGETDTCCIIKQ